MFFANLGLGEFLILLGGISAVVTALYLLDRARRKQVVATLRFWREALKPAESTRRRVRQPLSLLLQLLGIALLLLAIAGLHLGSRENAGRDHVLLLDASAWMGARTANGTWMDEARTLALAYVDALPSQDRVMVVRADILATPITGFETDRELIRRAIRAIEPGMGGLLLGPALEFAGRARSLHARRPGEVVFAGSGRLADEADWESGRLANLRYLPVSGSADNAGLVRIGLRHSASEVNLWEVFVAVRNYGRTAKDAALSVQFAGAPAAYRGLRLAPRETAEVTVPLRTQAAGLLEVRIFTEDDFPEDDWAQLEVPSRKPVQVAVYSNRPALLQPLLGATPLVQAAFRRPQDYQEGDESPIVVLDGFNPPRAPRGNVICIAPPRDGSPVPVVGAVRNSAVTTWRADHPLAAGLRTEDLKLEFSEVFAPGPSDVAVASTESGPVIVARTVEGGRKEVILGFHPMRSAMKYELAAPLLFANIIRWMQPEVFRHWEMSAGHVGSVEISLPATADVVSVRVQTEQGDPVPFTVDGETLRFFTGTPRPVRVTAGDLELVYSPTLPAVPEPEWEPPGSVQRGIPPAAPARQAAWDVWRWLALIGGVVLLLEWMVYGRFRRRYGSPAGALPADPGGSGAVGAAQPAARRAS